MIYTALRINPNVLGSHNEDGSSVGVGPVAVEILKKYKNKIRHDSCNSPCTSYMEHLHLIYTRSQRAITVTWVLYLDRLGTLILNYVFSKLHSGVKT